MVAPSVPTQEAIPKNADEKKECKWSVANLSSPVHSGVLVT